jgi:hypothetical protein
VIGYDSRSFGNRAVRLPQPARHFCFFVEPEKVNLFPAWVLKQYCNCGPSHIPIIQ